MKKEKKKIFVIVGAVVACLAVVYVGFGIFFQSHFCFGTTIDGIKAGGKSVEKVEQLITEEIDSYVLNLAEREDCSESISGESIQIAPVFNGEVEELLNGQNGFAWVVTLFKHDNLELAKVVTFDEDAGQSDRSVKLHAGIRTARAGGCNCFRIHSGRIFLSSGRLWYNDR